MTFYANAYANVVDRNDDWHAEASRSIRGIGAKIGSFAIERPRICLWVPPKSILETVSSELIRLSNGMVAEGERTFRMLDENDKSVAKIKSLLKLKKPT